MRENLFRGKSVGNREWLKGENIKHKYRNGREEIYLADSMSYWEEIIPETFGQHTGMTDKNGKKIFEGDICLGSWKTRFEVYWDKERAAFMAREKHDVPYGRDIDYYASYSDGKIGAEVIGNIYDNPELLNEVQQQ